MGSPRIFVDGQAGTTGLRIREWLQGREDLTLVTLDPGERKDPQARRAALNAADVAIFCLPDEAAAQGVEWAHGSRVRILDASTAHRVAAGWIYGLPELEPRQRARIAEANRVSNPGCYAVAVILLVRPLIEVGLLDSSTPLGVHALSGYSGGGRSLIERWEDPNGGLLELPYPVMYALESVHKHIPEMTCYSGLVREPQFLPSVGAFRCGMRVEIPLPAGALDAGVTAKSLWEALDARYAKERFVCVHPFADPFVADERSFDPRGCNDSNRIELWVIPNPAGHVVLIACLDNLGKGAATTAVQNLNLMLGLPEEKGVPA